MPRNPTTFSKRLVSEQNGNLLSRLAERDAQRGTYVETISKAKILSQQELDQKLKRFTPSTRHDAIYPTKGTRRKNFHGDVVCKSLSSYKFSSTKRNFIVSRKQKFRLVTLLYSEARNKLEVKESV